MRSSGDLTSAAWLAAAVLLALSASGPAAAASKGEVMRMVSEEAARSNRVPVALALAVAKVESDFNDQAISSAGARGVMQIMPRTAMGEFGAPAEQLMDPQTNVKLGIAYLERLFDQYGQDWELALSHYNGGRLRSAQGRFVAHSSTRRYVDSVIRWSQSYQDAVPGPSGSVTSMAW